MCTIVRKRDCLNLEEIAREDQFIFLNKVVIMCEFRV